MKSFKILLTGILLSAFGFRPAKAQSFEAQQLILNVTKLGQFKAILQEMYDGYTILTKGYNTVKDLTQGNFSLHEVFLDGLLQVSPAVRDYKRIGDIISAEGSLVSEYKKAYGHFKQGGHFDAGELDYMGRFYSGLTKAGLANIDQLTQVITAGKLRMSDDERLRAIDHIHDSSTNLLQCLRAFNRKAGLMQLERRREADELQTFKQLLL